ncbi:peptidoglycan DD-metalloendopeptidase family protein [Agromyces sp. NPDC058136]|uniref:M23 family metallopeptidase n=1 Tax=Agromyces sp. NPDC058136 TaxID=3346354 RepID=UPI0036DA9117
MYQAQAAAQQAPAQQQATAQQAPAQQPAWPSQPMAAQPVASQQPAAHPFVSQPAAAPRASHPGFDELFSGASAPTPTPVAASHQLHHRTTPATPTEAEPIDHPVDRRSASAMSAVAPVLAPRAAAPVAPAPAPAPAAPVTAPAAPARATTGFDDLFAGLGADDDEADESGRRSGRADRDARAARSDRKAEKPAKNRFGKKAQPEVRGARRGATVEPAGSAAAAAGAATSTAAAAAAASADFASLIAGAAAGPRTAPVAVQLPAPEVPAAPDSIPHAPRGAAQRDDLAAMIDAARVEAEAYDAEPAGRMEHPAVSARRSAEGASRAPRRTTPAAEARPVASGPKNARPARRRNRTRSIASVVAMSFAAMLAVATSVPSLSLLTPAEVQAMALESVSTTTIDGQRVEINDGVLAQGVDSEGYKTQTIEEYAQAAGIRAEATFTNNPSGSVQWPFAVGVHIGDRFGYRDCAGCSSDHHGQDFNPGYGADIQSIADGVVVKSTDSGGSLGVVMMIEHQIDGQTVVSVYAHMISGSRLFEEGDVVEVGDVIGETGNTGMSTGPHLHFEIRIGGINGEWVDPLDWLYANTN